MSKKINEKWSHENLNHDVRCCRVDKVFGGRLHGLIGQRDQYKQDFSDEVIVTKIGKTTAMEILGLLSP